MRKRFWQGAVLLGLVTLVFTVGNFLVPRDKAITSDMLGHDFLAFYTAGTFVREGRIADLYDLKAVADAQAVMARQAGLDVKIDYHAQKFGPWWNPPFYAWVFVPLSLLSFSQAVAAWTLLNLAALTVAGWLLWKMLAPRWMSHDALGRPVGWKTSGLLPLLVVLSMPFLQALSHGQNTLVSLAILSAVVFFWRQKRAILAGMCCALLGYKPQLAAVVACVLAWDLGLRAIAGLLFVGSGMVLVSQITLPGAMADWLLRLPANVHWMQVEHAYLWERHATLKAFWRLLFQGKGAGEMRLLPTLLYGLSFLAVAGLLVRAAWSRRRGEPTIDTCWSRVTERQWRDRLISATICCAPLLMPFYFDYDLMLLAIPATLLAAEELNRPIDTPRTGQQVWLMRAWAGLYVWMLFNPGTAAATRVNLNVVLLSVVATLMTLRATRPVGRATQVPDDLPLPEVAIPRRAA